jgi:hypothetical protein
VLAQMLVAEAFGLHREEDQGHALLSPCRLANLAVAHKSDEVLAEVK